MTSSDTWLGSGNTLGDYGLLLLFYAALVVVIGYGNKRVEPGFRKTYGVLAIGWAVGTFVGNYLLWRAGFMSFLPWLNNFAHTVVWIGLCLGFLYAGARTRPPLEQFLLFAIFSFIVKQAERRLLGTWELDHFFFIQGNAAYILGWSVLDGLYPGISVVALRLLSRRIPGLVAGSGRMPMPTPRLSRSVP